MAASGAFQWGEAPLLGKSKPGGDPQMAQISADFQNEIADGSRDCGKRAVK